jgi:thiamine-phosphate pyrophosphorylase
VIAQQLCDGGADLIQLRAKGASIDLVRQMAQAVHAVIQPLGVGLVINDHLEVAREIGAEFCHLGQEDFFGAGFEKIDQVRAASSSTRIGLSSHSPEQAQRAQQAGADYIAIGPVYATATKPTALPVGLEYVRWAAQHVQVPWFAIGGINLENLGQVLAAGARRICVVSAILNASNVAERCREFKTALGRV